MEKYKQELFGMFGNYDNTLLETIQNNPYLYYVEEDLTSKYGSGRYHPAVVFQSESSFDTEYYWLFNGEIKDWDHPFKVVDREEQ